MHHNLGRGGRDDVIGLIQICTQQVAITTGSRVDRTGLCTPPSLSPLSFFHGPPSQPIQPPKNILHQHQTTGSIQALLQLTTPPDPPTQSTYIIQRRNTKKKKKAKMAEETRANQFPPEEETPLLANQAEQPASAGPTAASQDAAIMPSTDQRPKYSIASLLEAHRLPTHRTGMVWVAEVINRSLK
jgi:hypothetical protein